MADKTGSCLCRAVAFEITGPLRPVIACHCHQCRKQTGTYMSSTAVKDIQTHRSTRPQMVPLKRYGAARILRAMRFGVVLER